MLRWDLARKDDGGGAENVWSLFVFVANTQVNVAHWSYKKLSFLPFWLPCIRPPDRSYPILLSPAILISFPFQPKTTHPTQIM